MLHASGSGCCSRHSPGPLMPTLVNASECQNATNQANSQGDWMPVFTPDPYLWQLRHEGLDPPLWVSAAGEGFVTVSFRGVSSGGATSYCVVLPVIVEVLRNVSSPGVCQFLPISPTGWRSPFHELPGWVPWGPQPLRILSIPSGILPFGSFSG